MQNLITKLAIATVGVTFFSQGVVSAPALAETTYLFDNADYDITLNVTGSPAPGILNLFIAGDSINAPFGLTQFLSNTYTQLDPTGLITFDTNPTAFNLQSSPGFVKFSGTGSDSNNEISGDARGNGFVNLATGEQEFNSIATITDGEGRFSGAVGQLTFSFSGIALSSTLTSFRGHLLVSGSLSTPTATVPEPSTVQALLGIGVIGVGVLLRQRNHRSAS
jgi:hypothetical protein